MQLTVELPDAIASQLPSSQNELHDVLASALRKWHAGRSLEFASVAELLETLAELPTAEEVLALKPSPELQARVTELLAKNRSDSLSADEDREWRQYEFVEHLVRLAKGRAALKAKNGDE